MTRVIAEFNPAGPVALVCRPYRRWVDDNDVVHLPAPVTREGNAGLVVLRLDPTGVGWCWVILEDMPGGITRFVKVPDSDEDVSYRSLIDVDPDSLEPTGAVPLPEWWAELQQIKDQVDGPSIPRAFEFVQSTPLTVWDIDHGLGIKPAGVRLVDADGNTHHGDIQYLSPDMVRVSFPIALTGTVYLS